MSGGRFHLPLSVLLHQPGVLSTVRAPQMLQRVRRVRAGPLQRLAAEFADGAVGLRNEVSPHETAARSPAVEAVRLQVSAGGGGFVVGEIRRHVVALLLPPNETGVNQRKSFNA